MKFKDFFKKYQLILILSFVVVVMVVIKLSYKEKLVEETIKITPTPTIIFEKNTNTQEEEAGDLSEEYPLAYDLPYKGDGYKIEKYINPFVLEVKIEKGTIKEAQIKAEKWIETQMGEPETHILVFKQN